MKKTAATTAVGAFVILAALYYEDTKWALITVIVAGWLYIHGTLEKLQNDLRECFDRLAHPEAYGDRDPTREILGVLLEISEKAGEIALFSRKTEEQLHYWVSQTDKAFALGGPIAKRADEVETALTSISHSVQRLVDLTDSLLDEARRPVVGQNLQR